MEITSDLVTYLMFALQELSALYKATDTVLCICRFRSMQPLKEELWTQLSELCHATYDIAPSHSSSIFKAFL